MSEARRRVDDDPDGGNVIITNRDIYNNQEKFKDEVRTRLTRVEIFVGIGVVGFLANIVNDIAGIFK